MSSRVLSRCKSKISPLLNVSSTQSIRQKADNVIKPSSYNLVRRKNVDLAYHVAQKWPSRAHEEARRVHKQTLAEAVMHGLVLPS